MVPTCCRDGSGVNWSLGVAMCSPLLSWSQVVCRRNERIILEMFNKEVYFLTEGFLPQHSCKKNTVGSHFTMGLLSQIFGCKSNCHKMSTI